MYHRNGCRTHHCEPRSNCGDIANDTTADPGFGKKLGTPEDACARMESAFVVIIESAFVVHNADLAKNELIKNQALT